MSKMVGYAMLTPLGIKKQIMIICRFDIGLRVVKLLQVHFFGSVSVCRLVNG